jgi:integrase
MEARATLYTRTNAAYSKVTFNKGKDEGTRPDIDKNYTGTFYLRLSENGKRVWKPFKNIEAALTAQANIETNLDRARKGIAPLPAASLVISPDPKQGTIAAAVAEFITYSESRIVAWRNGDESGLAPGSVEKYRKAVQDFAESCAEFGAVHLSEFRDAKRGEAILLNFKIWLQKNTKRKKGKAAYSDTVKFTTVGDLLARNGIKMKTDRAFNPHDAGLIRRKDVPRVKKPGVGDVVFYTPEDLTAMLKATDGVHEKSNFMADDLKDLVMVLLCTGMRDEEVQHLTWSDIIWANGDGKLKITVQDKPQYDWRVKDHERRVVSPDKNAILKARLTARQEGRGDRANRAKRNLNDLIFPTHLETPDQNFADRINALQKRAEGGKKGYVFSRPEARNHILHNFRKSYATYQMLQGVPVRNIQRDLGHSELATTERYLAIVENPDKVRKQYEAIS